MLLSFSCFQFLILLGVWLSYKKHFFFKLCLLKTNLLGFSVKQRRLHKKASMSSTWALLITSMFPCLRGVSVHSLNVPIEFSTVRDYVAWNLGKKDKLLAGNKLYRATFQASVFLCFNPQMLIYLTEYYLYNGAEMVSTPRIPPLHQRMWGKAYKNLIFIPTFLTQTQDIWCVKLSVLPSVFSPPWMLIKN